MLRSSDCPRPARFVAGSYPLGIHGSCSRLSGANIPEHDDSRGIFDAEHPANVYFQAVSTPGVHTVLFR
ncbi:MAG: hypothetical protein M3O46_21210 [Myxococcota bacterium]|nr:hypothetical protein [Myxococcota bacterium]